MQKKAVFILVAFALVLSACASSKAPTPMYVGSVAATAAPAMPPTANGGQGVMPGAPATKSLDTYNSSSSTAGVAVAQERLVVQNVDLTIVVADPQKKMDAVNQLAKDLGGYLVSMNMSQVYTPNGDTVPQGTISIRVPATKLDDALTQIKAGTVDVPSENRSGQDVTSQYVDLQSQLTNLQKAETDLQAIMDEAKNNPGNDSTTKTQDVLNVYNQIVTIRGQIEQITGQMKYIEETTSTSSINVTIVAEQTVKPIITGKWKPLVVANEAAQSLVKFLQGFVDFLIRFIVLILPILIIIFGPIALIIWAIVAGAKRRKARKAKAE